MYVYIYIYIYIYIYRCPGYYFDYDDDYYRLLL